MDWCNFCAVPGSPSCSVFLLWFICLWKIVFQWWLFQESAHGCHGFLKKNKNVKRKFHDAHCYKSYFEYGEFFEINNILTWQTMAQKFSSCFAFKILALLACNTLNSTAWLVIVAPPGHISLHYTVSKIEQHILHAQSLTSLSLGHNYFTNFSFSKKPRAIQRCNLFTSTRINMSRFANVVN